MKGTRTLSAGLLAATLALPAPAQDKVFTVGIPLPLTGAEAKCGGQAHVDRDPVGELVDQHVKRAYLGL